MTTFRNRLRLSFVAVAMGVVIVAGLVILAVGRGATDRDARDVASSVAAVSATNIGQIFEARGEGPRLEFGARPERRGARGSQAVISLIARNLAVVNATLISIDIDGTVRDLSRETFSPGGDRTVAAFSEADEQTSTRTTEAVRPFVSDLLADGSFTTRARGHVFAGVPVELGSEAQAVVDEAVGQDATLVVVARRRLGTAGLGPLGPGLLLTFVLALIAALSLAEALARRLRGPLLAVSDTSRAIAAGDLDARVALPASTDQEVAQIGETIDALAEQLGHEREQRQQFLQDISHELRTPLTSVRGHAELLTDDAPDSLDIGEYTTEVAESGRVIERESLRMERLIEDLLDLSRFDTGQMSVTPTAVDVATSVRETVSALRAKADRRSITVETLESDAAAVALADQIRLDQVITNLVGNAIDFAESVVQVETSAVGNDIVVVVRDDGPGLGDQPEQFFERHRRGTQPADRTAGLGVGLSIVETFVTAMGGTVTAANGERGAIFTVTLPKAQ